MIIPDPREYKKSHAEAEAEKKQEYTLMGRFLRTRGLRIYAYCPASGKVSEIEPVSTGTLYMEVHDGKCVAVDRDTEKAFVDSRMVFFEALNIKNARKRVNYFRAGKIPELCNLRKPGEGIKP